MNAISARPAMRLSVVRFRRFARLVGWLLLVSVLSSELIILILLVIFCGVLNLVSPDLGFSLLEDAVLPAPPAPELAQFRKVGRYRSPLPRHPPAGSSLPAGPSLKCQRGPRPHGAHR